MAAVIAIVGRPNVGKSTLFNRLSRSRDALVDDRPGVTRDRLYAVVNWGEVRLTVIDTGGFDRSEEDLLTGMVRGQVVKAVEESDRIVFVADGREGIMPGDLEMADLLRRTGKEVYLAVNKIDGPELDPHVSEFYALGIPRVYPLSAAHGYGLRTLMDDLTADLPAETADEGPEYRVRVAVLGRPNVGKSSLINRVLGVDRLLVSEIPGTTRDAVDILCTRKDREYLFIDTAGIRRKGRVREKIDKFSTVKALRSLDRCHVAVVVMDASSAVADQDARICGYAFERGRATLLVVNKWDLVKNDPDTKRTLEDSFERHLKFFPFAPRLHVSALTGQGVGKIFDRIEVLYGQFSRRIGTGEVNRALEEMVHRNPPPKTGRGGFKLFYATQTAIRPPTFVIFVNRPESVHFSYQRFLTNQLREQLGLDLTPIRVIFRKK
ncbi:MAG: ribosome biogenesis GTPase Der [Deltaproteobacteria bacterium]|nr:ribosome biogenesis GTPase Der [Deltaproteobacteria bacterium]